MYANLLNPSLGKKVFYTS